MPQGDLVKIGALWKQQGDKGDFLSGKMGDARVLVFTNNYKETDKHPDFIIYVTNPQKREEADDETPF
jgi:uncharacterized protein (DUF736 family)